MQEFSFNEAETVVKVDAGTLFFDLQGTIKGISPFSTTLVWLVPEKTTAVENKHVKLPEQSRYGIALTSTGSDNSASVRIDLIPENITEEVTVCFYTNYGFGPSPERIDTTRIRLVPNF